MQYRKLASVLFTFFLFLFGSLLVFTPLVSADGALFSIPKVDNFGWRLATENNQKALISYADGRQKMLLAVNYDSDNSDNLWLFPVPSQPNQVTLNITTDDMPTLFGHELKELANDAVRSIRTGLLTTQVHYIPIELVRTIVFGSASFDLPALSTEQSSVEVHQHLEKAGMTSELITAANSQDIIDYLQQRGLQLDGQLASALDHYLGQDYSFVVSWISSTIPTGENRAVDISFPTEKLFFPLLPTSVYGETVVPAEVAIMGYVSPEIFADIAPYTEVNYYRSEDSPVVKYTKVTIDAPARVFTQDLWINNRAPLNVIGYDLLVAHQLLIWLFLLVLISIISSLISGLIIFKHLRRQPLKLVWLGLLNCFSIVGLAVAIFKRNIDYTNPQSKLGLKKIILIFLFSLLCIMLPIVVLAIMPTILLCIALFLGLLSSVTRLIVIVVALVFIICIIAIWRHVSHLRVTKKHSPVSKSKSDGATTGQKIAYLIIFSLDFILLTECVINLLKLLVI